MDKMGTAFVKTKANEVIEQAAGTAKQKVSTLIGGNKDKAQDAAKQPEPAGKKAENAMGKALDFGKNLLG